MADKNTLDITLRTEFGKRANYKLRKAGKIPAVVYGGKEQRYVAIDDREFEKKYLQSIKCLGELNATDSEARLGKKLLFLIRDFVATLTDWEKETAEKYSYTELYAKTWAECRNFVLPMNPVRKELEFAVKSILISLGVKTHSKIKKGQTHNFSEIDEKCIFLIIREILQANPNVHFDRDNLM